MCVAYARVGGQEETRYLKWRHTTQPLLYIEVPTYDAATHVVYVFEHENKIRTHTITSSLVAYVQ